jgi:hypothetical protein
MADPNPSARRHAAGATSDGSLYIGWAVDSGSFFDDMERPMLRRLPPASAQFEPASVAGRSTDDYLTSLTLVGNGSGIVVHYCGSDVDPFGFSSTGYRCFASARSTDGAELMSAPRSSANARLAFTRRVVSVAYCDGEDTLRFTTAYGTDPGEPIAWPCPEIVALELDEDREPLLIVATGNLWHALSR